MKLSLGFMLQTSRLLIRPFQSDDAALCSWFRDQDVMRWIPGGADADETVTSKRIDKYREHFDRFGFSKYVVIERSSGTAIGDCGLMHLGEADLLELGYRIAPDFQGRGYATEAALAVLDEALERGVREVHAIVEPDNEASLAVLTRKLGFVFLKPYVFMETTMSLYVRRLGPS